MAGVSWIKLSVNMFNDEKIQLIESLPNGDVLVLIWIKLLTLAGKSNQSGYCNVTCNVTYTDEMLSVLLRKPIEVIQYALQTFEKFEMIENTSEGIYIINWEKHQNIDALDKLRTQTRERVQRFRVKKNELQKCNVTDTLQVTQSNAIDIDIDIDIDKDKDIKHKNIKHKTLYLDSVYLSQNEFENLLDKFQTDGNRKLAIETLNNYLQASGRKYKSHYHVLIGWVYERVMTNAKSQRSDARAFGTNRTAESEKPRVSRFPTKNYLDVSEMS